MIALTITPDGRITLAEELLQHLGVVPDEAIAIQTLLGGRIEIIAARAKAARGTGKISDAFGILKRENGPSLTIEEMGEAAADGWAGKRQSSSRTSKSPRDRARFSSATSL